MKILDFLYHRVVIPFLRFVFKFYKTKIRGMENIPKDTGFILAGNHLSYLDAPLMACGVYPRLIHWIAHKNIYYNPIFTPICLISRCILVNGSVEAAEKVLQEGDCIGIFPQGAVCCTKFVKKGRKGVAVLAHKTGIPVVPCHINAEIDPKKINILPKFLGPLELKIGKPIYFEKVNKERIPVEILEKSVAKVIKKINELNPEK